MLPIAHSDLLRREIVSAFRKDKHMEFTQMKSVLFLVAKDWLGLRTLRDKEIIIVCHMSEVRYVYRAEMAFVTRP